MWNVWVVLVCALALGWAQDLPGEAEQEWAYVNVRPDAYKFWWLYKTTHPDGFENRPLIMWLQGGPGGSSTGYGNFEIIGEIDLDLNIRNASWVQEASLLFVDNPVGAGYSYVTDDSAFTTDNMQIANDLLTLLTSFLNDHPEYQTTPFYIFGQSYGGKMAADFAKVLLEAVDNDEITCNLQGYAMGNAWMSPFDSTLTWAGLLQWMSVVDEKGHDAIMDAARASQAAADAGNWQEATNLWRATQVVVNTHSNFVDFYNILKYRIISYSDFDQVLHLKSRREREADPSVQYPSSEQYDALDDLMNGQIKEYLGIPEHVVWGSQRSQVFSYLEGDFMKNVTETIDELLATTDVHTIFYQGALDLICDTMGAMDFVRRLSWDGLDDFLAAERSPLTDPWTGQTDTWVKAHEHLKFYWNLNGGHALPKDTPEPALRMLRRILDDVDR